MHFWNQSWMKVEVFFPPRCFSSLLLQNYSQGSSSCAAAFVLAAPAVCRQLVFLLGLPGATSWFCHSEDIFPACFSVRLDGVINLKPFDMPSCPRPPPQMFSLAKSESLCFHPLFIIFENETIICSSLNIKI